MFPRPPHLRQQQPTDMLHPQSNYPVSTRQPTRGTGGFTMTTKTRSRLYAAAMALVIAGSMLTFMATATATIRDWSPIVTEDECTVMPSGAPVEVWHGDTRLVRLEVGDAPWVYEGPAITVEARVFLQRDNVESASFLFDCTTQTTTTTNPPTTTTTQPPCNPNVVECWCTTGIKYEPVATPFIVPDGTWTLAVVKAGSDASNGGLATHQEYVNPAPGDALTHATGKDISHVILCGSVTVTTTTKPPTETTTTTTQPPTVTTSPPIARRVTQCVTASDGTNWQIVWSENIGTGERTELSRDPALACTGPSGSGVDTRPFVFAGVFMWALAAAALVLARMDDHGNL